MVEIPATTPLSSSDEVLLVQAKAGPEGIGAVYDAYADRLYGFLMQRCGQKELAEDLVSKTFVKFIEQLPQLEWRGVPLHGWLCSVASHLLIDHWRSASARSDASLDEQDWDPPSSQDDPAWYAETVMEKERLLQIMKSLSSRDQEVLDLHFFGQQEPREIAALLDVSPNHASVLIYRALGRLRTLYLNHYGRSPSKY